MNIDAIKRLLPNSNWNAEPYSVFPGVFTLSRPGGGVVTVNLFIRGFSLGSCLPRCNGTPKTYSGRGWMKELVSDAAARLNDVMDDEDLNEK